MSKFGVVAHKVCFSSFAKQEPNKCMSVPNLDKFLKKKIGRHSKNADTPGGRVYALTRALPRWPACSTSDTLYVVESGCRELIDPALTLESIISSPDFQAAELQFQEKAREKEAKRQRKIAKRLEAEQQRRLNCQQMRKDQLVAWLTSQGLVEQYHPDRFKVGDRYYYPHSDRVSRVLNEWLFLSVVNKIYFEDVQSAIRDAAAIEAPRLKEQQELNDYLKSRPMFKQVYPNLRWNGVPQAQRRITHTAEGTIQKAINDFLDSAVTNTYALSNAKDKILDVEKMHTASFGKQQKLQNWLKTPTVKGIDLTGAIAAIKWPLEKVDEVSRVVEQQFVDNRHAAFQRTVNRYLLSSFAKGVEVTFEETCLKILELASV